jgi:glycosyltransferase involved in cell wall biosynthesis
MAATVSVVIPAFNARRFIEEALDSVAAQTLLPAEIVVVDDGSADGTADIVEEWAARTGMPVKLIRQANLGVPVARNRGMAEAGGDWIALLDADDLWLPSHLAVLMQARDTHPEAVAVFGDTVHFSQASPDTGPFSRDKAIAAAEVSSVAGFFLLSASLFEAILPGLFFAPTSTLFSRQAALAIGGFDPGVKYIEDRDFFLRLARQETFVFADTVISRNRIHDNNITHPKNAVRNAFYILKLLRWLRRDAAKLALDEREMALTRAESGETIRHLLLAASSSGLAAYLAAVGRLLLAGEVSASLLNPRLVLRAAYHSFTIADGQPFR